MTAREQRQLALVRRHMDAEFAQDVKGTMATLVTDPYYEIHPTGLRIRGYDAVHEMYKRLLPGILGKVIESRAMTLSTGDPADVWVGPDGVVIREHWIFELPGCDRVAMSNMSIFSFIGELLRGESFYCSARLGELFSRTLGEDFAKYPGVERI